MNNLIPRVVRFNNNEITLDVCHGEIPDVFRELWFDPLVEMELPDTKVSNEEFEIWIFSYRMAPSGFDLDALEISKCN